jgi:hypothetical protein
LSQIVQQEHSIRDQEKQKKKKKRTKLGARDELTSFGQHNIPGTWSVVNALRDFRTDYHTK